MLTAKQEKFVQGIIEGMSQADAYRSAYDTSRFTDKSVWEKASALMNNVKVKSRLTELRDQIMKPSIMSAQERLELLTRMASGEEPEKIVQFIEGERVEFEVPASLKTRQNAIDLMNKMQGEYTQKIEAEVTNAVNITIELTDD